MVKRDGASVAREELVELGSASLCADLGLSAEPREDHAPYDASWLEALAGLRPSEKHDRHTAKEMQPDCKAKPRSRKLAGSSAASSRTKSGDAPSVAFKNARTYS